MCIKNSKLRKEKKFKRFKPLPLSYQICMSELHFLHSWHITTTMLKKKPSKLFFTPEKSHMALKGIK